MPIPKVAVVQDLSGLGKCSLTAAIPILSVMGVQACPLPTAALSNQTGFSSYACADLSSHLNAFLEEWEKRQVKFDGIFTGFLDGVTQTERLHHWIAQTRTTQTLVLVDPVLGDHGQLYPVFDRTMCQAVGRLVELADVITPNLTEACLLTGMDYAQAERAEGFALIGQIAKKLLAQGPRTVVITGIHRDGQIINAAYTPEGSWRVGSPQIGCSHYSGTGDILSSVVCAGLVRGQPIDHVLHKAVQLLEQGLRQTCHEKTDPNEGIAFEPYLRELWEREE